MNISLFKPLPFALSLCLLLVSPAYTEPLEMSTHATPSRSQNSEKANELFDQAFQEMLDRSPIELTSIGSRKFYDRWDDLSIEEKKARFQLSEKWAREIREELSGKILDEETELSKKLFLYNAELERRSYPFAEYDYPVNQMFGLQAEIPSVLINNHQIKDSWDAEAYILRLERLPATFGQLITGLKRREKNGILPPTFVFDYVLSDVANLLQGYPLTSTPKNLHPIFGDFQTKVKALNLSPAQETALLERGKLALTNQFAEAYRALETALREQKTRATDDDGVWKFPRGEEYYAQTLAETTTTNLSAQEIHTIGLREVARIQSEMQAIMKQVGFQGSLQDFFRFMKDDSQFYHSDDRAGRQAYLDEATVLIEKMKTQLDRLFLTTPKAELVVKAVESFREQSAGKAFYQTPALDGSRPGYYYANLYDMSSMPKYAMEALAYHEGIPGHHMQLSLAQEFTELPRFRRLGHYTAYIEGWGLYSELLPKEYGFYQDPYSDFGRLAMELFRACRLVVDTGIHDKRWSRQEALDYYLANTPNSKEDCQKMVDRHIVMPGQATAYKVGMDEILRLREFAKTELDSRFDIREFHQVVLGHGAVPLAILEDLVRAYVIEKKAS